jgi:hypothetical protein
MSNQQQRERAAWVQDVHITCPVEQVEARVKAYEREFANEENVIVLTWGCSYKKEQGFIVLEWDYGADLAFLERLKADKDVEDYSVYEIPSTEVSDAIGLPFIVPMQAVSKQ